MFVVDKIRRIGMLIEWRAVLVCKYPAIVPIVGLQVVVRVADLITGSAVAYFQKQYILRRVVDQSMRVAGSGLETGAHAGRQRCRALVGCRVGLPSRM